MNLLQADLSLLLATARPDSFLPLSHLFRILVDYRCCCYKRHLVLYLRCTHELPAADLFSATNERKLIQEELVLECVSLAVEGRTYEKSTFVCPIVPHTDSPILIAAS